MGRFYHKLIRKLISLSPDKEKVAKGLALGCAVSFTPFVGFHSLIALGLAALYKENKTAALLGTLFGNPWTFPLIWYLDWETGIILFHNPITPPDDFTLIFKEVFSALIKLDFNAFFMDIWPIYKVMLIGCIPYFLAVELILQPILKKILVKVAKRSKK